MHIIRRDWILLWKTENPAKKRRKKKGPTIGTAQQSGPTCLENTKYILQSTTCFAFLSYSRLQHVSRQAAQTHTRTYSRLCATSTTTRRPQSPTKQYFRLLVMHTLYVASSSTRVDVLIPLLRASFKASRVGSNPAGQVGSGLGVKRVIHPTRHVRV